LLNPSWKKEAAMLKKIILALDGSENAERAVPWVKRYAAKEIAQVTLVRAVVPDRVDPEFIPSELQEARNYLQRFEAELNYAGIPAKIRVAEGRPAEVLAKTAAEEGADLLIMTTRGGSPVQRWLLGGVTEQTLRLSPAPVLVVRSRTPVPKQARVRRIIVPVDGSRLAEASAPWVKRLARLFKARVVFLHVYPVGPAGLRTGNEENYDALHKRMARLCKGFLQDGVKAAFKLQRGDAADRILKFADANDVVVTTTHGFGGFKRWIFGSVAEKLIHAAEIPIVVYKTAAQAEDGALVAS
jgi:nucleotide-binding universal stress UspA family protein